MTVEQRCQSPGILTRQLLHHRRHCPRVFVKIDTNWRNGTAGFLFCVHPRVRPHQRDGHIRKEDLQRLAVRRPATVR